MRYTIEQWNDCYIVTDTHTNEAWPCGGLDTVQEMVGAEYDELIKSLPSNHIKAHSIAAMRKARKYNNSKMYPIAITSMRVMYGNLYNNAEAINIVNWAMRWRKSFQ